MRKSGVGGGFFCQGNDIDYEHAKSHYQNILCPSIIVIADDPITCSKFTLADFLSLLQHPHPNSFLHTIIQS